VVSDEAVKLTDVSEEISKLISEIGERYGMVSPITARRLTGGYANDVFRLDADGPPTVLHLKHPPGADGDRLHKRAVTEFLTAYRAAGGTVPSDEDDLIVPLIRARRILEVLRAPTDRHPRWDLQQANLRAYAALSGPHCGGLADPRAYEP
jgi:hypothetical protein